MRTSHHSESGMKPLTSFLGAFTLMACTVAVSADVAPGSVALTVRLPNPGQKLLFVDEVMPVKPGPLTLYYPKWIPGDHSPDGSIEDVIGLQFTVGGQRLSWQRDELDKFTFHLTIPADAERLDLQFE